jgi:hypothetical protein
MPTKKRRDKERAMSEMLATAGIPKRSKPTNKKMVTMPLDHLFTGIYSGGLMLYDNQCEPYRNPNIGKGVSHVQRDDKEVVIDALKIKHQAIWSVRGRAKDIALTEGLSERTVQRYFKDYPIKKIRQG